MIRNLNTYTEVTVIIMISLMKTSEKEYADNMIFVCLCFLCGQFLQKLVTVLCALNCSTYSSVHLLCMLLHIHSVSPSSFLDSCLLQIPFLLSCSSIICSTHQFYPHLNCFPFPFHFFFSLTSEIIHSLVDP